MISAAIEAANLPTSKSNTLHLKLHGWREEAGSGFEAVYGSDISEVHAISDDDPALGELIHPRLPYRKREIVWAARREYARTTEDVLARRTRALFLNAQAAIEAAPEVSQILARELGRGEDWRVRDLERFLAIAKGYKFTA